MAAVHWFDIRLSLARKHPYLSNQLKNMPSYNVVSKLYFQASHLEIISTWIRINAL